MPIAQNANSTVSSNTQDNTAINSDQLSFNFGNLCGTPYTGGSVVFSSEGTSVYSPVSNRIMITDLAANRAATARPEMRSSADMIVPMPTNLSKFGRLVLSIDIDGYGILFEAVSGVVLNRMNFKGRVKAASFSHCGKYLATATGRRIKVWKSASVETNWQFVLFRTFAGHLGDVSTIDWAPPSDGQPDLIISGGEDSIIRVWSLKFEEMPHSILNEHSQQIVGAYFFNNRDSIVAINRSGSIMVWSRRNDHEFTVKDKASISTPGIGYVTCCSFDYSSGVLCLGLSGGAFSIYEIFSLSCVQSMSVGAAVTSVDVASGGDWIAVGVADAGQLIVWEWRAENFILKQQGHHDGVNCVAFCPVATTNSSNDLLNVFENANGVAATFSAGGGLIATGGVEGKVKLWHSLTGFCFVTLADHTSSVEAVCFTPQGNAIVSASMDGSIRAYDLLRYRNFRTYTAPDARVQFGSLAIDPSGDIIAAGSANGNYSIYLWSTRTGQCLDILPGHEARISHLSFSPGADGVLASTSWDSSLKIWNIYAHKNKGGVAESLVNQREVSCCAFDPIDGSIAAVATLAGHITFWDTRNGNEVGSIDGIRDIGSGRRDDEKFSFSSLKGKRARRDGTTGQDQSINLNQYFSQLAYGGASGRWLAAISKHSVFVCIYDPLEKTLINRIELTRHFGLSGVRQFLNSKFDTVGMVNDDYDSLDQTSKRARGQAMAASLPGVERGDMRMITNTKRVWRTNGLAISQDGLEISIATSEGAYILTTVSATQSSALPVSIASFNPSVLSEEVSTATLDSAIEGGDFFKATIIALSLNEIDSFKIVFDSVPLAEISQIVSLLPPSMFSPFLSNLALLLHPIDGSKSVERCFEWISRFLRLRFSDLQSVIHQSVIGRQIRASLCAILQHVQTTSLALGSLLRDNHFVVSFLAQEIEDEEKGSDEVKDILYEELQPVVLGNQ